ncbi:hypothetical protein MTBBW1_1680005 [Desulfamplus magnetovallimortis]|uniref:Uncharacterized protein n=1 Tax=Desulfamplus magnetovallimortis TaxID=1246637 RepID=A0A1W1H9G5_9BACT|nr:hypothetical protein [Desulfamplus magnetovallimortis]SLM29093.1 hypothetical protein MTBBW1_1680005 [Desulfamplus magnetovallimortis]
MDKIDIGMAFGKDGTKDEAAIYLYSRLYYQNTDIPLIAMEFQENLMFDLIMISA